MRSIPSFVTCISPLLLTDRLEGQVLEPPDFRLQKPQVHEGGTAPVLTLGIVHPRSGDSEEGDAPAVRSAYLDALKLAAADEAQGPEEEVVGLEHVSSLRGLREERWDTVTSIGASPSLL
jgi:hypothetical protein